MASTLVVTHCQCGVTWWRRSIWTRSVYHPLVTVYPVLDAMLHMGNWDA